MTTDNEPLELIEEEYEPEMIRQALLEIADRINRLPSRDESHHRRLQSALADIGWARKKLES